MKESLYVVIAANHCWGAGESLREALSNACLRENTRLSFFDYADNQEELQERWDSWNEYGKEEWQEGSYDDPTECVIYYLDHEVWDSFRICDMSGGIHATPKDPEMSSDQASKKLGEIQMKALFDNGLLKPLK
jgi:hypothetical protein